MKHNIFRARQRRVERAEHVHSPLRPYWVMPYTVTEDGKKFYRVDPSDRPRRARRLLQRKTLRFLAAPRRAIYERRFTEEWTEVMEGVKGVADMTEAEITTYFDQYVGGRDSAW